MVTVNINGKDVQVEEGTTILDAAKKLHIKIPTLCYNPDVPAWASCGMCVVRAAGTARMMRACCTVATDGMKLITHDPEIVKARRIVLELILSNHPDDCLKCIRSGQCELQDLAAEFGIREQRFKKILKDQPNDYSYEEVSLHRDKCINCGRCVQICQHMQDVWALEYTGRGGKTVIGPVGGVDMAHSPCVRCGQCASHCPVGAITTTNPLQKLWDGLADTELTSVVQFAPSVRVGLGKEFGLPEGTITTQKIYTALRMLGFKYVFDTNFSADLTIMEEANEFVHRLTNKGVLPLFTSCCPAWVDFAEKRYSDLLPNLSSAKSPQQIMGAVIKSYFAEKVANVKPEKIFSVSIMPCTAKAYEARRDDHMKNNGVPDVDMVLTTREFAMIIRQAGIDFTRLEESVADNPLGQYSGAGTIFGATGGVMEAAIRTAYNVVTKKELGNVDYLPARGLNGVKVGEVDVDGIKIRIAVVHQLGNVDGVIQEVRKALAEGKEPPYHFIEVMACRGGCVAGGGQPYGVTDIVRQQRAAGLYSDDKDICSIRVSHKNPMIIKVYNEYFTTPNSEKAHHLLHTKYVKRDAYN